MNGGESEKKGEEGLEICEIGENTNPQITQSSELKTPENGKGERQSQSSTQNQSINQQTEKSKQNHCLMSSYK